MMTQAKKNHESALQRGFGVEFLEARFLLFSVPIHIELTNEALPFLNTQTAAAISAEQVLVDTVGALDDANHFDNCKFMESVANINEQLSEAVEDANPNDFDPILAAGNFGHGLHTVEDFYAHSNWVNLGQTTLFDDTTGYWAQPTPYSLRDGVMIVQGALPFPGGSISRSGLIVSVNTGSATYPGLITGQFGAFPADCPPEAQVTHEELNKDSPDRPLHAEARALAVEQVKHEFSRLMNLVRQTYGSAEFLLDAWVKDDPASRQQALDLLPAGSVALGTVSSDGTLTLNMGAAAAGRGAYVNATDGNEAFTIQHIPGSPETGDGEVVSVMWNGYSQQFTAKSIVADGGAGTDSLTLLDVRSAVKFDGGADQDVLDVRAAADGVSANFKVEPQQITLGAATSQYAAVELLKLTGTDGADRFEVRATSTSTAVELNGGGGDDQFVVDSNGDTAGGTVDGVQSKVTIAGGAGSNTLVLEDSSDTTADRLTITPTTIGAGAKDRFFGVSGTVAYSDVSAVTANLPAATTGDVVRLTPSATTAFYINGNGPSRPGRYSDELLIDVAGLGKYTKLKASQDSGAWLFSTRQIVAFTGVESVKKA